MSGKPNERAVNMEVEVEVEPAITSDSSLYRPCFYGILNAHGQFWTPLAFESPEHARQHICTFWGPNTEAREQCLRTHRIVPVRIQLTALASKGDEG